MAMMYVKGGVITLVNGFLTSFCLWPDGAGRLLFQSTCSSQRSKLWPPRSSSGRRGLGQALKPKLVRSGASANRKLDHFFLATELLKKVPKRSMPLEATVPTANCRVDEHDCLFITVDCGLSIST
jgi:hypothetical protein